MNESFKENLIAGFQRMIPLLCSILFMAFSYVPFSFIFPSNIRPLIGVMSVYFWLVNRPDIFNLGSACCVGIVEDMFSSVPFGSNVLVCLLLYVLITNFYKFFNAKPFAVIWYGFMITVFTVLLFKWLIVSVYYSQFLPISTLFFSFVISAICYPLLSFVYAFVQYNLVEEET